MMAQYRTHSPSQQVAQTGLNTGLQEDNLIGRIGRIVILLSSISMVFIAVSGLLVILLYSNISVYGVLECFYLVVQAVLGFYAALYRSQEATIIFSVLCAFNSLAILVTLAVEEPAELEKPASSSNSSFTPPSTAVEQQRRANAKWRLLGVRLLWVIAGYDMFLSIAGCFVAACVTESSPAPGVSQSYSRASKDCPCLKQHQQKLAGSQAKQEHFNRRYAAQPVQLISQSPLQVIAAIKENKPKSAARKSTESSSSIPKALTRTGSLKDTLRVGR